MKHYGDITQINGYEAPVVDCIIGGSPCQDLSVAGKRAGLDGERSGLFTEQIRIVKEMREHDRRNGNAGVDIRPRYMVWENVPGAFSSNKGEDFRTVLEEIARVKDENAVIPRPADGKWRTSGCILGDGWSIAWRTLDAQFWGTSDKPLPQRRRRIALVADFGGQSAPEILFVRKGVSGDIEPGEQKRKRASTDVERSPGADDRDGASYSVENHPNDSRVGINEDGKVQALTSRMGTGGGNVPMVMQCYSKSKRAQTASDNETWKESDTANTLNAFDVGDVRATEVVVETIALEGNGQRPSHRGDGYAVTDKSYTLNSTEVHGVVYALDRASFNQGKNAQYDFEISDKGVNSSLVAKGPSAVAYCIGNGQANDAKVLEEEVCKTLNCMNDPMAVCLVGTRYIVRRLTPLECERLQGYPDGWTDIGEWTDSNGKKRQTSDAARYKALGNSIALPPWKWVLKRICACYERDATMASLFDGIGGFPYLWEQLNGKGSCLWASEIEEFPIAVTKARIG